MEVLYNVAAGIILSLGSSTMNEIGVWWGVTGELEKLRRTVSTIEAVLLHAEEQSTHNPSVKNWLRMLSEALYDAEDLLDEFSYETMHQQLMDGSEVAKKVRLFFSSSNQFVFGLKMGHKVKAIRKRLDEIAAEKNKFHLEERCGAVRSFVPKSRYQTHSSPPRVVIGREHDKEAVVQLLLSSDSAENVSVVSIVGIGGLGKTTLAQLVYNDDRVKNHFELKMWVCVSNNFDVQLLVKNVLESASRHAHSITQMDVLKDKLHQKINGKRYFLVLDDVWNEDVNKWSSFTDLLAGGAKGSKILITTRLTKVAVISRPIWMHRISGLSENESWSLFKQVAFKQGLLPNPSFEVLGKEIVAKCGGVPLAIRTIGGMLYFKNLESEWRSFKDKELSTVDVYKNDILPILKLSYNHLPSHYKHCFSYCSLYPKDFRIPVEELIQLWGAQGYLKSIDSNASLRDVGLEYFNDLFRLSFFQDVEEDRFGNIIYCKMHDLMHDLAVSVVGDYFSQSSHHEMTNIKNNTLHISVWGFGNKLHVPSLLKAKRIRTILTSGFFSAFGRSEVDGIFCSLRHLRVLDLSLIGTDTLPNSICKLKHLRYLDLSGNEDIEKLPDAITNLHNLQVLKLEGCSNLMKWPSNMSKLVNLIEIDNTGCHKLIYMPRGIEKLTKLEKLSEFVMAEDHSISNHIGGLDQLHSLNSLKGELTIKNLRCAKNAAFQFTQARLSSKCELLTLKLDWGSNVKVFSANGVAKEETGIEALCPHPNLKVMELQNYKGVKPPSWLPSVTNLMYIKFEHCSSLQRLPPLDQMPHLKNLRIFNLENLESIHVEYEYGSSSFFPSLTDLTLQDCPNLKGFERLSNELPCFPCLSQLSLIDCPHLTKLPRFPALKNLYWDGTKPLMEILKMSKNSASTLSQLQYLAIINIDDYLLPMTDKMNTEDGIENELNNGIQWQSLKVLRSVKFIHLKKSVALPKGLQYVSTLQRLYISNCPNLESIPEWISKLIALQRLTIIDSPQLEERCKNNSAEDWPKISQIGNIEIGYERIQRDGCYLL